MAEWQVPASFSQTMASEGEGALPARILDRFSFFTLDADGTPQPQPLSALADGVDLSSSSPFHCIAEPGVLILFLEDFPNWCRLSGRHVDHVVLITSAAVD